MSGQSPSPLRSFWEQFGRHGATYLVAEGLARGGIYLLFLWLATVLSVSDFGILNVFVSVLTLLGVVVGLGMSEGLVRFHFRDEDLRPILALAILVPVGVGLFLLLLLIPLRSLAGTVLGVPSWFLVLAVALSPIVAIRQSGLALLRAHRLTGRYLGARVLEPAFFLVAVLTLFLTGGRLSYDEAVIAYSVAIGGVGIIGAIGAARWVGLVWSGEPFRRFMRYSLPLAAHAMAMTGLALFDQVVIQQLLGAREAGIYAFAYRFGMAMYLVTFAFTAAWGVLGLERLSAGREATLRPFAGTAFTILLLTALGLAWTLPVVARWVGGNDYSDALKLIPLVVYAYLWAGLYGLAVVYLAFRDRTATLAAVSATAFLANAALNYLTIPRFGVAAAAVTTIVCYAVLAVLVLRSLGVDRQGLPWSRFALQIIICTPAILAPWFVYR